MIGNIGGVSTTASAYGYNEPPHGELEDGTAAGIGQDDTGTIEPPAESGIGRDPVKAEVGDPGSGTAPPDERKNSDSFVTWY